MSVTISNPLGSLPSVSTSMHAAPLSDRLLSFVDRHRRTLFLLLFGFYLLGFNGKWRLEPDSALYLTIGRNLAEGAGYTYHGVRHHLAFPGPPFLFAAVFKLFGTESVIPHLFLMLGISLVTLALTYRLFLLYAGRPTAVLVTLGVGISRLFYRYSFELLSDMPFLLGVMAFLAGFEGVFHRGDCNHDERAKSSRATWLDWTLLIGGLMVAVVMRPAMWALLGAILLALLVSIFRDHRRGAGREVLIFLAVVIAVAGLFWAIDPRHSGNSIGNYEDALFEFKLRHFSVVMHDLLFEYAPRLFEGTLCQALFGARISGFSPVAALIVLGLGVSLWWRRPLWGAWFTMTVAMVLIAVKPLDRYFLQVLPLLVFAWWSAIRWVNHRLPARWGNWVFAGLLFLGGTTNLLRGGEFFIEQRRAQFLNFYREGHYASFPEVSKLLRDHVPEHAWVLVPPKQARILTFLSGREAIEPAGDVRVDPVHDTVYVLEPLDEPVQQWLASTHSKLGPQISGDIQSQFDPAPWRLHRALPGDPSLEPFASHP